MDTSAILRFLRDNSAFLLFLVAAVVLGGAWVIAEVLRANHRRDEVMRLRQRLIALQQEQNAAAGAFSDPVVLASRWLRTGNAATTSDGGCLIYIDRVLAAAGSASLTMRVDGEAVHLNHMLQVGSHLEAPGKYGTYILKLYGVDGIQANVAIALRGRHQA